MSYFSQVLPKVLFTAILVIDASSNEVHCQSNHDFLVGQTALALLLIVYSMRSCR